MISSATGSSFLPQAVKKKNMLTTRPTNIEIFRLNECPLPILLLNFIFYLAF
jgi:hypothetical protein